MTSTATTSAGPRCAGLPTDWWETGDGGNRLALLLCGTCTGCPDNDPTPTGFIRDGVAYDDNGHPLEPCDCGYPSTAPEWRAREYRKRRRDWVPTCQRCKPITIGIYKHEILRRLARKEPAAVIGRWLGVSGKTISEARDRWMAASTTSTGE
jgi:hypothetical protein